MIQRQCSKTIEKERLLHTSINTEGTIIATWILISQPVKETGVCHLKTFSGYLCLHYFRKRII